MLDAATASTCSHLDLSEVARAARDEVPVTDTCVLAVSGRAVAFVADLLAAHQRQLGTRAGRRALTCWGQAVAFWRWMLDGVEPERLALDAGIGRSTGHRHVNLDATLIHTDRVSTPGPTSARTRQNSASPRRTKVDQGAPPACGGVWSGKHHCHGANRQVVTAPDGWPLWVSPMLLGRVHDVSAARQHPDLLATLARWRDPDRAVLADLGYEGERTTLTPSPGSPRPWSDGALTARPAVDLQR